MVEEKILYTKPSITDLEISYASDAAQNGWHSLAPLPPNR